MALTYHKTKLLAAAKYGTAVVRPQDVDKELGIQTRRTNLGFLSPLPDGYQIDLEKISTQFDLHPLTVQRELEKGSQIWLESSQDFKKLDSKLALSNAVAVDFEFHNDDSFDGFICVSSLSMGHDTYVADCLGAARTSAKETIGELMTSSRTLKVFCGADNDIFRLRKDWSCFPRCVVDLQDMFMIWKKVNFDECFRQSSGAVSKRLSSKQRGSSDLDIKNYLHQLGNPGLEFLMDIFRLNKNSENKKLETVADWRCRPLHPNLLYYSACDAFFTLVIFYDLLKKIGTAGLRQAMSCGIRKLVNSSRLPSYSLKVQLEHDCITTGIINWREYLSKNLDKKPDCILKSVLIAKLSSKIRSSPNINEMKLGELLQRFGVKDDHAKSARLLLTYISEDKRQLSLMKEKVCHRCNDKGHVARFCFESLTKEEERERKREYRSREETRKFNERQSNRRWLNYCQKRHLDPATAAIPWKK